MVDTHHPHMLTVNIPCHPLSRAIMLSEYGNEPIVLDTHDILFEIINSRLTPDDLRKRPTALTTFVEITVGDRLASHLANYGQIAGARLYKFHKHLLCRYADAQVRTRGKGQARPAIQEFLNLYQVEEDAYGLETAYKLYQRFCWEIQKKNAGFLERMRRKPGAILSEKRATAKTGENHYNLVAELAVTNFMVSVRARLKRHHKRLEKQARAYIYVELAGLSVRQAADVMKIPPSTVHHCLGAMRRLCRKNATYNRLLDEALALPAAE